MISIYLVSHYGRGGNFIIDNNYYIPLAPVAPVLPYDKRIQTSVIEWEVFKAQNIENAREVKKLEDDRASWFAIIMGQLSPASKQLVQAHTDWVTADADKNPLLLWQIITATHIVARSGNPAMDRRAALLAFNTIEQRTRETLPDYRLRLQQCVQVLEAINHPHVSSVEEQVLQFIIGMKGKYSAYSQHIQNDMSKGVAAPATIAEAEHEAEHWRQEISSSNTLRPQSDTPKGAYVTTGSEKNAKKNKKTARTSLPHQSLWYQPRICHQLLSRVKAVKAKAQTTRA